MIERERLAIAQVHFVELAAEIVHRLLQQAQVVISLHRVLPTQLWSDRIHHIFTLTQPASPPRRLLNLREAFTSRMVKRKGQFHPKECFQSPPYHPRLVATIIYIQTVEIRLRSRLLPTKFITIAEAHAIETW